MRKLFKIGIIFLVFYSGKQSYIFGDNDAGKIRKFFGNNSLIEKENADFLYGSVKRHWSIYRPFSGMKLDLKDIIKTNEQGIAEIEVWQENGNFIITKMDPETELKITSSNKWILLFGNLSVFATRKLKIVTPVGECSSVGTIFFTRVLPNKMLVMVLKGSVLLSNNQGKKIIRTGEYGYIIGDKAPNKGEMKKIKNQEIINNLKKWNEGLWSDIQRQERLNRLKQSSHFCNLNTGFTGADIHEPTLDFISDVLSNKGKIRILIDPPK